MTTKTPILEVQDLVKDFGGVRAVNHCTLQIFPGAITGIIGPNGAGKTTLFNLVSGAMAPTSGRIFFNGRRIDGMGMHRTFGLGLMRTFQIPREMKRMTVLENLMLVPAPQSGRAYLGVLAHARQGGPRGAAHRGAGARGAGTAQLLPLGQRVRR